MNMILLIATLHVAPSSCWIRGPADRLGQRPSPLDSIAIQVGDATIKLCYGRPSTRGREVMGGVVPFDQAWRLGANEATSIHVPFPAENAGVRVAAATYSFYAIPAAVNRQIALS